MAKSMRSKREKRLRAIRREMVEPLMEKKDVAKFASQEAALAAPKLPVRTYKNTTTMAIDTTATATTSAADADMDVDMGEANQSKRSLKPLGKKMKKKIKIAKKKYHGKGKIRRKNI